MSALGGLVCSLANQLSARHPAGACLEFGPAHCGICAAYWEAVATIESGVCARLEARAGAGAPHERELLAAARAVQAAIRNDDIETLTDDASSLPYYVHTSACEGACDYDCNQRLGFALARLLAPAFVGRSDH